MEYDSNIIKPVESLDNITNIIAAREQQERKRKQQYQQKNQARRQEPVAPEKAPKDNDLENIGIDFTA
jgi:hypothetical protein